jgi:hypothetical protein
MTTSPLAYIILLNWNGWRDTIECIGSCLKLAYPNYHILIVDNGSTDGSEAILRERFPAIEMLQTGENLGFAGGNNVGMRHALDAGADYIWLLNNDTIVDPNALQELVKAAEAEKGLSMVGSKIYYYGEPNKIWFAGGIWSPNKLFLQHRGEGEIDNGQYDEISPVYFITGCSLLIKADLIRRIGFMSADYFLYWEDTDWSARAHRAGARVLYAPKSLVWHKIAASIETKSYLQGYYYCRNRLLFYQRYARSRFPLIFLASICGLFRYALAGQNNFAAGYFTGMKDLVLRRFGRTITK